MNTLLTGFVVLFMFIGFIVVGITFFYMIAMLVERIFEFNNPYKLYPVVVLVIIGLTVIAYIIGYIVTGGV
jgi:hypothetical protein